MDQGAAMRDDLSNLDVPKHVIDSLDANFTPEMRTILMRGCAAALLYGCATETFRLSVMNADTGKTGGCMVVSMPVGMWDVICHAMEERQKRLGLE